MVKGKSLVLVLSAVLTMMLLNVQCEEKCGENEEFVSCPSSCPKRCTDVANMGALKICTMDCGLAGCVCKAGHVLDSTNKCRPEKDCPCQAHATFNDCGTSCRLTCENYSKPPACIKKCEMGCFCDEGYVKAGDAGPCVLKKDCPKSPTS